MTLDSLSLVAAVAFLLIATIVEFARASGAGQPVQRTRHRAHALMALGTAIGTAGFTLGENYRTLEIAVMAFGFSVFVAGAVGYLKNA